MGRDDIVKNIEKVTAKEKIIEKPPYKSKIWRKVNPVYELIARGFVNYVNDEIIGTRIYNSGKTDEMGDLIGIQSLMRRLPKKKIGEIENRLKNSRPIEEIIDFTALQIAEEKRTQDGKVLNRASLQQNPKLFMRALKKADPYNVYIESGELSKIEERAKKIRKLDKVKYAAVAALTGATILAGVYGIKAWRTVNKELSSKRLEMQRIEENIDYSKDYLSSLEWQINTAIGGIQGNNNKDTYQPKQDELSALESQLDYKKSELSALNEQVSIRRKEYNDLISKIEGSG